ncbi:uncharacterized protein VTP21DRAFT_6056 [Calcarisporiella thermophila]|uniref:uncharacterized protein n=1 Tax=Calcarisporiella thermophila TaxID=911321 RepID=UPI0037420297
MYIPALRANLSAHPHNASLGEPPSLACRTSRRNVRYNPLQRKAGIPIAKQSALHGDDEPAISHLQISSLIDIAAIMISTVWPVAAPPSSNLLPTRAFIHLALRRSKTTASTFVLALLYLFRAKGYLDTANPPLASTSIRPRCGRRMLVTALILANKFHQDRNYSNRAWARIVGLPVREVNQMEMDFLRLIGYRLFVGADVFVRWRELLLAQAQTVSLSACSATGGLGARTVAGVKEHHDALSPIDSPASTPSSAMSPYTPPPLSMTTRCYIPSPAVAQPAVDSLPTPDAEPMLTEIYGGRVNTKPQEARAKLPTLVVPPPPCHSIPVYQYALPPPAPPPTLLLPAYNPFTEYSPSILF